MPQDKKQFYIHAAIFSVLFVSIFLCVNFVYINRYILDNTEAYVDEEVFRVEDLKVLFLGDSRPATSIIPEYIPGSYNYCFEGENYSQFYFRARRVVGQKELETIVLPLDIHSFSDYRSNPYNNVVYWLDFASPEELSDLTGKPRSLLMIKKYAPFIGSGRDFAAFKLGKQGANRRLADGWKYLGDKSRAKDDNKEFAAHNRVGEHFKHYPEVINKDLFAYYLKTIELARENGIELVLVKYPVSRDYLVEAAKLGVAPEEIYEYARDNTPDYGDLTVLDYRDIYNDEYFFNSDHLNTKGAETFSRLLAKDLADLGLIDHPATTSPEAVE